METIGKLQRQLQLFEDITGAVSKNRRDTCSRVRRRLQFRYQVKVTCHVRRYSSKLRSKVSVQIEGLLAEIRYVFNRSHILSYGLLRSHVHLLVQTFLLYPLSWLRCHIAILKLLSSA